MPETTIALKQSTLLTTCSPRLLFEAEGKKRRGGDEDEGLSNDAAEVAGADRNGKNTKADHVVVGTRKSGAERRSIHDTRRVCPSRARFRSDHGDQHTLPTSWVSWASTLILWTRAGPCSRPSRRPKRKEYESRRRRHRSRFPISRSFSIRCVDRPRQSPRRAAYLTSRTLLQGMQGPSNHLRRVRAEDRGVGNLGGSANRL